MKNDPDGGDAYTNRIITLAGAVPRRVTVLLVVAAPLVMAVYLDPAYDEPALAEQRESVIAFARYCLPQVFFYGMFVLVGQILNARGRFGPMMWAPIANNVISVAGARRLPRRATARRRTPSCRPASPPGQELLLGLGSTLGIVVQLLVLLPYLRAAGFRYRAALRLPRHRAGPHAAARGLDRAVRRRQPGRLHGRGPAGLGGGRRRTCRGQRGDGTGYTVYSTTFLIVMVPHSIITVSLATAMLPRLSAQRRRRRPARRWPPRSAATLRTALAVDRAVRAAAAGGRARPRRRDLGLRRRPRRPTGCYIAVARAVRPGPGVLHRPLPDAARLLRPRADPHRLLHPVRDRGHQHRGRASSWSRATDAEHTSPALVLAYTASYAVGSAAVLPACCAGLLGRPATPSVLLRFLVRMLLAAAGSTAAALAGRAPAARPGERPEPAGGARHRPGVALVVDVAVFLVLARLLRLRGGHRRHRHGAPPVSRRTGAPVTAPYDGHGQTQRSSPGQRARGERACRNSIRPGDVLADRYRLVDLLDESGAGRFWRAHDRSSQRHVARARHRGRRRAGRRAARRRPHLRDRPRPPAAAGPRRRPSVDGIVLRRQRVGLRQLAGHHARRRRPARRPPGRLDRLRGRRRDRGRPRRAASPTAGWSPRTSWSTAPARCGSSASAVDAALHGLPRGRTSADVADLGGLLYCALTGRWPGVVRARRSRPRPSEHGRVLRPRQVRAGIPRPLDALCDAVAATRTPRHRGRAHGHDLDHRPRDQRLPARVRRRPRRAWPRPRRPRSARGAEHALAVPPSLPCRRPEPPPAEPPPVDRPRPAAGDPAARHRRPTPEPTPRCDRCADRDAADPAPEATATSDPARPSPAAAREPVAEAAAQPDAAAPAAPVERPPQAGPADLRRRQRRRLLAHRAHRRRRRRPPPFEAPPGAAAVRPRARRRPAGPPGPPPVPGRAPGRGYWPWDTGTGPAPAPA